MDFENGLLLLVFGLGIGSIVTVLLNHIPYVRMFVDVILSLILIILVFAAFLPLFNHGLNYYIDHIGKYIFEGNDFTTCVTIFTWGTATIIGTLVGANDSLDGEAFLKKLALIDLILMLIGAFFSGGVLFFGGIIIVAIIIGLFYGGGIGGIIILFF